MVLSLSNVLTNSWRDQSKSTN